MCNRELFLSPSLSLSLSLSPPPPLPPVAVQTYWIICKACDRPWKLLVRPAERGATPLLYNNLSILETCALLNRLYKVESGRVGYIHNWLKSIPFFRIYSTGASYHGSAPLKDYVQLLMNFIR